MPSDFNKIVYRLPKFSKRDYISLMTTYQTVLGFDTNDKAKFRFHVLQVFYEGGFKSVKLAFPKLKRATLYRWKKKYEASGKRLNSLLPGSTKPHHTRVQTVPVSIISLIRKLRQDYPRMGKAKVKRFVDQFCLSQGLETISVSSIGRTIKRFNLFYAGKNKGRRVRMDSSKKQRVKLCPKVEDTKSGYIQLDGVKFYYLGQYYYFLIAVDIVSKQAWVKLVPSLKSNHSREFLKEIITTCWYKVHTIHTDNGSEFKAYFDEAVTEAKLTHLWNYPKHPKTTGYVERFNWTVEDEFIFDAEDYLLYPEEFKSKLNIWLLWYNQVRPHQSLKYLSPYEYLQERRLSQKY